MQFPYSVLISKWTSYISTHRGTLVQRQSGFTLIELVTVIVILGILAAFAIPRFAGLESQARTAALNGLAGSVKSAAALGKALWVANGNASATSVNFENNTAVTVSNTTGYPTGDNAGIGTAVTDTSGYTITNASGVQTWALTSAPTSANCKVTYSNATTPPTVATTTNGC